MLSFLQHFTLSGPIISPWEPPTAGLWQSLGDQKLMLQLPTYVPCLLKYADLHAIYLAPAQSHSNFFIYGQAPQQFHLLWQSSLNGATKYSSRYNGQTSPAHLGYALCSTCPPPYPKGTVVSPNWPSSHLIWTLISNLSSQTTTPYWTHKAQLMPKVATLIDWHLLGAALHSCPPSYHMCLSKFASSHMTVGHMMALWKKWQLTQCPICNLSKETTFHVINTPELSIHPICTNLPPIFIPGFSKWTLIHTLLNASLLLCTSFHSFASLSCLQSSTKYHIGFVSFLLSHFSLHWVTVQANPWAPTCCKCSPYQWDCHLCLSIKQKFTETKGASLFWRGVQTENVVYSPNIL